jgi:diaminopimelate decarboxylase
MFDSEIVQKLNQLDTPFYYYDIALLRETLKRAKAAAGDFKIHYALKANFEVRIVKEVLAQGFGADCVSGGEIKHALGLGFRPEQIVFAGVGKSDMEILLALAAGVFCFNCESPQELEVINQIAGQAGKMAPVALRINPDVDANTHKYITTGKEENKFGIYLQDLPQILEQLPNLPNLQLVGLHFHIGSQITTLTAFEKLCHRVNELQKVFSERNIEISHLNLGGGLGIDYQSPDKNAIVDFEQYFSVFRKNLHLKEHQTVHFELGRSLVGQCGSLITRVLYVKKGLRKQFAIVDAGMTELIRPALYQAYHKIENLTSQQPEETYDVVGPICESADFLGKDISLPAVRRGDLLAVRSAGAYGAVMASRYNLREAAKAVYSDQL